MTSAATPPTLSAPSLAPATASAGRPLPLEEIRELLAGLDRRQRQAVTHGDGPLLVVAGPGTGKTEVITRRIAWLIATRRARASEILALTFTERAADEMQARVDVLVPYGQADASIQTFHAFGDRLLREHGFEIGRPDDPRVIGRPQAMVLLRDNVFELGLDRYLPLGEAAVEPHGEEIHCAVGADRQVDVGIALGSVGDLADVESLPRVAGVAAAP